MSSSMAIKSVTFTGPPISSFLKWEETDILSVYACIQAHGYKGEDPDVQGECCRNTSSMLATQRQTVTTYNVVKQSISRISPIRFTSLHLSHSLFDRWGTKDDRATTVLHSSLFSAFRRASPNFNPVHSIMLSSHLFFCLPLLPIR